MLLNFKFKKHSSWIWVSMGLLSSSAGAQVGVSHRGSASLGTVASNLTGATDVFTGIFSGIFYVIGIALVVASIMRYRDYRQNPVQTPLGRVILYLLAGLIIGFFPLIVNYISASIGQT